MNQMPSSIRRFVFRVGNIRRHFFVSRSHWSRRINNIWLSVAIGISILTATIILWQALEAQERAQIQRKIELEAASIRIELSYAMQERVLALIRMARRWERTGIPRKEDWEADATLYVQNFGGYQAIEWVDASFQVRWVVPATGNEAAHNLNLLSKERRRLALETARNLRAVTVTRSINLAQESKGFLVYVPIFSKVGERSESAEQPTTRYPLPTTHLESFNGFILGVFQAEKLFDNILHENLTLGYSVTIFDGSDKIYQRRNTSQTILNRWGRETQIDLGEVMWRVQVAPTPQLLALEQSQLPEVVLGAGSIMAFLLALAVHLAQTAQKRTKQVEATNQKLKRAINIRRQVEETIAKSQQQYQDLVNWIDGIVWEANAPTFQLTFVSQKAERLLGYPIKDWLNEPNFWEDHIHPDDRTWVVNFCAQSAQKKNFYEFEYRMIAADGRIVWLRDIVTVVIDNDQPIKLRGVMIDITAYKRSEEALRESEEKYRAVVEQSAEGIYLVDATTKRIIEANSTYLNLLGYSLEEILQLTIYDIVTVEPALIDARIQNVFAEKHLCLSESQHRRRDGSLVDIEADIGLISYGGNLAFCVVVRDITERKQAQETLRWKEALLRSMTSASPLAFYVVDNHTDAILYFNHRFCEIWGIEHLEASMQRGELTKSDIVSYCLPLLVDRTALARACQGLQAEEKRAVVEDEIVLQDGRTLRRFAADIWDESASEITVPQETRYFGRLYIFEDVTERKRIEAELRLTDFSIECSSLPTIWSDRDAKILRANQAACQYLGYSREQLLSMRVWEVDPQFPVEKWAEHWEMLKQQKIVMFTTEHQAKDGNIIPVEVTLNYVEFNGQEYSFACSRDISEQQAALRERYQAEKALRESQHFIQRVADATPSVLYIYDLIEGQNIYANREIGEILGYTPEDIRAMGAVFFPNLLHPEDSTQFHERIQRFDTAKDGDIIETEYRMKHLSGEWRWLHSRDIVFARTATGEPHQILGTATDITERKQAEEGLRRANQQLAAWVTELEIRNHEITLLSEMSDVLQACLTLEEAYTALATLVQPLFPNQSGGIFLISASRKLVEAVATWGSEPFPSQTLFAPNDCWALRRGHSHFVENGNSALLCKHIQHKEAGDWRLGTGQKAGEGERQEIQWQHFASTFSASSSLFPMPHTSGSNSTVSLCVPMMAQGEAMGLLYLSGTDKESLSGAKQRLAVTVAEQIALALANLQLRESLQKQSIRDPLTGLFNRRYLEESLEREIQRASRMQQPLGIIMLDVDRFKRFNDTFGHDAGDAVLRELGLFLQQNIRGSDIACRYGGEELTLILPEATLEVTQARAEQIREGVKHLNVQHRHQSLGGVTLSLGVAIFPRHGLTGEAVLRSADAALYQAKAAGRDRVVVAS